MEIREFIDALLSQAKRQGMEEAEVWFHRGDSFRASSMDGSVDDYRVSDSMGLGFRAVWQGKMGYASTQAFDEEAIGQLICGAIESAELSEAPDQDEIFAGEDSYPEWKEPESDLKNVTAQEKLKSLLAMDEKVRTLDTRVTRAQDCTVVTSEGITILCNTKGLNLSNHTSFWYAYAGAVAPENGKLVTGGEIEMGRRFAAFDPADLAARAVENTVGQLNAGSVSAGEYRVILHRDVMCDLLTTFCGMFSAENVWQKLSMLGGREGTRIASDAVTLTDDPLLPDGIGSCPFDAEGSRSQTKNVIENGILKTLLHNRKTAKRAGTVTTGNASRSGYSSPIGVQPTNMYFKPGEKTLDQLTEEMGEGLVITEVTGLHAGANPVSGDFSLLSKGYRVENGKRAGAVEQITVAGNYYKVLENIRAVGNDLRFPGGAIGSPSADIGTLIVSGQS